MTANSMPESAEPRESTAASAPSAPPAPAPAPAPVAVAPVAPASPASPLWLVGAYAVLVAWGVGTLVLFFTGVIGPR